jgi:molybdopterin molybdotransferase
MAAQPESNHILSFEDARHLVERHAAQIQPVGKNQIDLIEAVGSVLAEPVAADRDFPPFHRAARDGYAVRAGDLAKLPAILDVICEIKAGAPAPAIPVLQAGQAAMIMTGAPAPEGTDAVVMVEYTARKGGKVEISKGIEPGGNIVPRGSEAKRGEMLLRPGHRLDAAAIAVAASVGKSRVLVYGRPRIAVLATGDEVVKVDSLPEPTQIRNSNSYSLAAQIRLAGGEAILLPIAPDEPVRLRELITQGFEKADLLLLTGGVSMGKYDFVEQVLAEFRAEFFFTGVQIQPGRPVVFGRIPCADTRVSAPSAHGERPKYFFGLPGNPVSTMVTFLLFAQPMIEGLSGQGPRPLRFLHARLKTEVHTKAGLKRFLPAVLSGEFERAEVELARWGGSGDIAATARANCYVVTEPDRQRIEAGEWVPVLMK